MIVKTESDGDFSDIVIEDSGNNFHYEINIRNNKNGSCSVYYENADREVYTLLYVKADGSIAIDKPTLE